MNKRQRLSPKNTWALRLCLGTLSVSAVSGCSGRQSALAPAGEEAASILGLLVVASVGAVVIWCLVMGLLLYAVRWKRGAHSEASGQTLILWGGVLFPVAVLTALLCYALWLMPNARPWFRGAASDLLKIEVTGEQFWWRVRYRGQLGEPVLDTANEIRIPLGERIEFHLKATDVIHSFWIPALAGKMDMIPGRTNVLSMTATRPGIYRAPCAEFCGTSHALMAFSVIVMPRDEFRTWNKRQLTLRAAGQDAGKDTFIKNGCPACHAVRQIGATGTSGPDLSDFGQRQTVGAGLLENSTDNVARFIRDAGALKPDAHMPSFTMVPPDEIRAMAQFLKGLR